MVGSTSNELLSLAQTLSASLDPNAQVRESATTQLQSLALNWPAFYPSLIELVANKSFDLGSAAQEIRLQAILQFKNGVERYWRKGSSAAISPRIKAELRPRLLEMVTEENQLLAKNIALCIGKIARLDYGTDWEALPSTLLSSLQLGYNHLSQGQSSLILNRSLVYLHSTIKALATNRMARGRLLMSTMGETLFEALHNLYQQLLKASVEELGRGGSEDGGEKMGLAYLLFKTLSKFFLYGFKNPMNHLRARNFFLESIPNFTHLHALRLSLISSCTTATSSSTKSLQPLTKHIFAFGKFYRGLLTMDPTVFSEIEEGGDKEEGIWRVNAGGEIVSAYWIVLEGACGDVARNIADNNGSLYPERLIIQALLLLKSTMGDWASRPSISLSGAPALPPDFIIRFAELLLMKLLPLREGDIEKWVADPEEWMNEEEADRFEYELRPCVGSLLHNLFIQYRTELQPKIASWLEAACAHQTSQEGILLKEGIYCALSRKPCDLADCIDFDSWLETALIPEATGVDLNYRIIRRRIASLLGPWVLEDRTPEIRSKIYQLLVHLLSRNPSTDLAIRLTAATSLGQCGNAWDFEKTLFVQVLPRVVEELVGLMGEVESTDSRMRLNGTLGVVLDRVGEEIVPYAPRLAEILVSLWVSTGENHFQTSILITLTKLVEALGTESQSLQAQICPIIGISADPNLPSHVFLQEEALELWQVLIKRSSILSPDLLQLLPLLTTLLAAGTDILPRVLKILESYLLINADVVLQLCATELFISFEGLFGDLKLEAVRNILHALNLLFQVSPAENWAPALNSSKTFLKLFVSIAGGDESSLIISKYLCSISRIVLASPTIFHQLVAAVAQDLQSTPAEVLGTILSAWIDKLDNMSQRSERKLTALALGSLISTIDQVILGKLPEIISLWCSVLAETEEKETVNGDGEQYGNPDDYPSDQEYDYIDTLETVRRTAISRLDPVQSQTLRQYLSTQLSAAQEMNGGAEVFSRTWLGGVDPLLIDELGRRLSGTLAG